MGSKTVTIPNISCGHCTATIEREIGELTGVTRVETQVAERQASIQWDDARTDWPQIAAVLSEIGFPIG